jgi:PAS domain S-box-containing protein
MAQQPVSDTSAQSISQRRFFKLLGILPIPLLFGLIVVTRSLPSLGKVVFEPPLLLPLLNTVFVCVTLGIVAYFALRSYLASGNSNILFIGCGALALGTGSLLAGWLEEAGGPNVVVTIHNLATLLAALLWAVGALQIYAETNVASRRHKLATGYCGVLLFIALIAISAKSGELPVFFRQGVGPTLIRQLVLALALILLALTVGTMLQRFRRKRSRFIYWYALALALLVVNVIGISIQTSVGNLVGWVSRSTLYLGCVYFLIAVVAIRREAQATGQAAAEALASIFQHPSSFWQDVLSAVDDAIISCDQSRKILLWNRAAERIFGYASDEVVGEYFDEFLVQAAEGPVQAAIQLTEPSMKEMELIRKDGSRFFSEITTSVTQFAAGEITTLTIRDITERKQAEEALRKSEEEYRLLVEHAPTGIFEIEYAGPRFRRVNDAMCQILGYTREELLVLNPFNLLAEESKQRFQERIRKILQGEKVDESIGFQVTAKDGRLIWALLNVRLMYTEGKPTGALVVAHDITERRHMEEAMRESEARFRTVIENSRDGINMLDLKTGHYVFMSPAQVEMTGFTAEEMCNLSVEEAYERVHPDDRHISILQQQQIAAGQDLPDPVEYRWKVKSGEYRWFSDSRKLIRDAQGIPIALVGVSRDITSRKETEAEIMRHSALFRGINRILTEVLHCDNEAELGTVCLTVANELSHSQFGFIGEIGADGLLHDLAISDPGWSACTMDDQTGHRTAPGNFPLHSLYGRVLQDRAGFFTNAPAQHPDSTGIPQGHPPLSAFLGVPLFWEDKVWGMIAVANRPEGYGKNDQDMLEALAPVIMEAVQRRRIENELAHQRESNLGAQRARAELAEGLNAEINHRMKNNLMLISAMLQMQADRSTAPTEHVLQDAIARIAAISAVHEEMYRVQSDQTRLDEVLARIVQMATKSLAAHDLQVEFTADPVQVQARFGSSLAIIANELITNAIKHSMQRTDTAHRLSVRLQLDETAQTINLLLWNSGKPVPPGFDPHRQKGLGLQLVYMLAVEQARGSFTMQAENDGTLAEIIVPIQQMS